MNRTASADLLRVALDVAERGWSVIPLRPNDKRPAFPNHNSDTCTGRDPRCRAAGTHIGWEPRATLDTERIRRAWALAPYNVGIVTGPSGLVAVDLDMPKAGQTTPPEWNMPGVNDGGDVLAVLCEQAGRSWPGDTYTVTTGRGGSHLYYRHPEGGPPLRNTTGGTPGALGWLIDTRAHGGYVVASGSIVAGRPYTVAYDTDPAPLPGWLAERLTPKPLPPQQPVSVQLGTGRRAAYLDTAIRRSLDAIGAAPDGALNRTLYGASVALGQLVAGGALDADDTEALLLDAATRARHPAGPARRTIRSGFRAATSRPRALTATTGATP